MVGALKRFGTIWKLTGVWKDGWPGQCGRSAGHR